MPKSSAARPVLVGERRASTDCRTAPASAARRPARPSSCSRRRARAWSRAKRVQHRMLVAAGRAPAAPDVEQEGRALEVGERDHAGRARAAPAARTPAPACRSAARADSRSVSLPAQPARRRRAATASAANSGQRQPAHGSGSGVRAASASRKRRSVAVTKPPSAISSAPSQIQRTNGFTCTRTAQLPPPSGSPSAT